MFHENDFDLKLEKQSIQAI